MDGIHRLVPGSAPGSSAPTVCVRAGPPKNNRVYGELVTGNRYAGDGESLLIPVIASDMGVGKIGLISLICAETDVALLNSGRPKEHAARFGPRFELFDFTTVPMGRPNSYLLATEPGLLR